MLRLRLYRGIEKGVMKFFLYLICFMLLTGVCYPNQEEAVNTEETKNDVLENKSEESVSTKHQLEVRFSYDHLSPHGSYGSWETIALKFSSRPWDDFSYFLELVPFFRKEGNGVLGVIGAYKDWTTYLYTYSAVSSGSKTDYLPQFRIDHDFNFKLGKKQTIVWTVGVSYIDYHSDYEDIAVSTGLTLYWKECVGEYRIFRNHSSPGNNISYTHLLSLGYGREKWQWTYLHFYIGKEAYLATYISPPEKIREQFIHIIIDHKHWLKQTWGIFGDVSYFKLWDNYEKYGFTIGLFIEF